jgi:hypothetical protein
VKFIHTVLDTVVYGVYRGSRMEPTGTLTDQRVVLKARVDPATKARFIAQARAEQRSGEAQLRFLIERYLAEGDEMREAA